MLYKNVFKKEMKAINKKLIEKYLSFAESIEVKENYNNNEFNILEGKINILSGKTNKLLVLPMNAGIEYINSCLVTDSAKHKRKYSWEALKNFIQAKSCFYKKHEYLCITYFGLAIAMYLIEDYDNAKRVVEEFIKLNIGIPSELEKILEFFCEEYRLSLDA